MVRNPPWTSITLHEGIIIPRYNGTYVWDLFKPTSYQSVCDLFVQYTVQLKPVLGCDPMTSSKCARSFSKNRLGVYFFKLGSLKIINRWIFHYKPSSYGVPPFMERHGTTHGKIIGSHLKRKKKHLGWCGSVSKFSWVKMDVHPPKNGIYIYRYWSIAMWVPSILNNPSMSVVSRRMSHPKGACPFHCGAAIGIVDRVLDSVLSSLSWRVTQWIGLRENLQETMVFTIKYRV